MEKNIIKPNYLSLTTHQLATGFLETGVILSTASGFLYEHNDKIFLITNWHNVSGKNNETGQRISENHAGIPDVFLIYFRNKNLNEGSELRKLLLYEDKEMTKPKWLIHPKYKDKVDVVAIEIEQEPNLLYSVINKADFDNDIPPEVSDDVFIIGYPFEDLRYLGLPIWKRGSIATEPSVNEGQMPKLLIDTATRSGLSGSPVIYQRVGIHKMVDGKMMDNSLIGRIRGFLGVYSGRIGKDENKAQLGIVWKEKVIQEIIDGKTYGDIEFQQN